MRIFRSKVKSDPVNYCRNITIGGEAGEGIKSAGKIISLVLAKLNYNVFFYDEYPSLIRGGHNSVHITFSNDPVYTHCQEIDILVCLNRETFDLHKSNLKHGGIIIYDETKFEISSDDYHDHSFQSLEIPLKEILNKHNLPKIISNTILLSAALSIVGADIEIVKSYVEKEFSKKVSVLDSNLKAVDHGYDHSKEFFNLYSKDNKSIDNSDNKYFISGNEAVSLGSIKSGLKFFAAYPMTPASTILDTMMSLQKDFNIIVKQTEDEIAAINMAIGGAFAGARSMVGTSGGGFSLMTEGLGLAAITETPIVIALSQRPGPATGMPTWTAQGDILFILHASQDEFPRIILTPTDIDECFYLAFISFNLAEKYQVPVFILLDKFLSESTQTIKLNKDIDLNIDRGLLLTERILSRIDNYQRYELTESGISSRSIPGQEGGVYLANSDESDEYGFTNESSENRKLRVQKRANKFSNILLDMPDISIYGSSKSDIGFISFGSTKGSILEAMRRLNSIDISTKLISYNFIEPFNSKELEVFLKSVKNPILIENNSTSQFGKIIKMHTGIDIKSKLLKYDGRPIMPHEIVEFVLQNQ